MMYSVAQGVVDVSGLRVSVEQYTYFQSASLHTILPTSRLLKPKTSNQIQREEKNGGNTLWTTPGSS